MNCNEYTSEATKVSKIGQRNVIMSVSIVSIANFGYIGRIPGHDGNQDIFVVI